MTSQNNIGVNTLTCELKCPHCGVLVKSGIGFRAGCVNRSAYNLGDKVTWDGQHCWPAARPAGGNLKTVGYFNCDNPGCGSWRDCFPEVQEVLITICADVIIGVGVIAHKPHEQSFDIIEV